eukprot:GEMP01067093.1.p1 GENE.GEMP01067093.1~~GEMP01067093.1.p1  ORF type:complete len:141 (+),score=32.84 GEMP01067093.1:275-697(+)
MADGRGVPYMVSDAHDTSDAASTSNASAFPDSRITGEVFEVDDTTLASLDILEQVPTWYQRVPIEVELTQEDSIQDGSVTMLTVQAYVHPGMPEATDLQSLGEEYSLLFHHKYFPPVRDAHTNSAYCRTPNTRGDHSSFR